MSEEVVIKVENVSKDFVLPHERVSSVKSLFTGAGKKRGGKSETQHALKDISFDVKKGEFFGIVGRNGSGKSTLLKILANIYQPTEGSVQTHGKLVPFIELGVGFNPELTGRENVYLNGAMLGFAEKEIAAMYDDIVAFAELERFMDQKLKNYSSGMQVRLAFSMATRSEADILLIDEVLAVGDADFQRKCFDYFKKLKKNNKTVIFVSHDMDAVREYCDRAIMIEKSRVINEGNPNTIAKYYSRMFIEGDRANQGATSKDKRWGTGKISYTDATVDIFEDTIVVKLLATAKQKADNPNFGFIIKNAVGQSLLGSNTYMKRQKLEQVKKGEKIHVTWTIPNILQDGEYYVEPAIVGRNGDTWDWWEEAAEFTILKEERTSYLVNPDVLVKLEVGV